MSKPQLHNIENPFIEQLLKNLDSISEQKTSIKPAKHTFDMLLNSKPFQEKYTPIHTKFENVLNKYNSIYPEEFESYVKNYNTLKEQFNSSK